MRTRLTFRNESSDRLGSDVVFFYRDRSGLEPVAWTILRRCRPGWWRAIEIEHALSIAIEDPWGNRSPLQRAAEGSVWQTRVAPPAPIRLCRVGAAAEGVRIENTGAVHPVGVGLYRGRRAALRAPAIRPGGAIQFAPEGTLYVAAGRGFAEGEPICERDLYTPPRPLELFGLRAAELVMTGAGVGPRATPLRFHLRPCFEEV